MENPEVTVDNDKVNADNSVAKPDSGDQAKEMMEQIKVLTEEIKELKRTAIRPVEIPPQPTLQTMTPEDHVEQIYTSIQERISTYKNPTFTKGEGLIYLLKSNGVSNEEISSIIKEEM